MKIIFDGYYGYQNSGDDAFVEVANWGAIKYWGNPRNIFFGNKLPQTIHKYKSIHPKFKGIDRLLVFSNSLHSDYFISAGGSTFHSYSPLSCRAFSVKAGVINNKLKRGGIGVSLGPFKNSSSEKMVINYLKKLSFLALRDSKSYEFASSLNLPYKPINAFDLAALLPLIYNHTPSTKSANSDKKTIAISICNYERYTGGDLKKEEARNVFFKKLVQLLSKTSFIHFKVYIINGHHKLGDLEASKELLSCIDPNKVTLVPYSQNIKKTWEDIANCDFMISTRLHASIFACYAQIPFMLLEYHRKCSDFLNDVGQHQSYRIYNGNVNIKETYESIMNILTAPKVYKKPSKMEETIEKAEKNFTETIPLIS